MPISEPRYPLHLTIEQLRIVKATLDTAAAKEADPDAQIFQVIDLVREVQKKAVSEVDRPD